MSDILTSREIADAVRDIRPHVEQLTERFKDAALRHVAAERAYKLKEAEVFLEAKGNGATDEMAKRVALVEAEAEKTALDELAAEKAAARLGSDAWQSVLDVYSALSHTLNRELKWHQQAS